MDFSKLTAYMDALAPNDIPSVDVAVYKGHECVYRHSAGYRDYMHTYPTSDKDVYCLYSATKFITATCGLQLVEKGLLSLDDEVEKYLPEMADVRILNEAGELVPPKQKILVRHLYTMATGLNYETHMQEIWDSFYAQKKEPVLRDMMKELTRYPLDFEPGSHYRYGIHIDMIGAVVEAITGMSIEEYMQENICKPLGMTSTSYRLNEKTYDHLTDYYRVDKETGKFVYFSVLNMNNVMFIYPRYQSGGGGVFSTTSDLVKFCVAMANDGVGANGAQILKKETIDLMRTPQLNEAQEQDYAFFGKSGYSYGLGVRTLARKVPGGPRSGIGEFGWSGTQLLLSDPENRVALVVSTHTTGGIQAQVHATCRDLAYEGMGL